MARLRTFIALPVTDPVRDRLTAGQQYLARTGAKVKWVEEENLHVTLLFLGEVDNREVLDICRATATAAAEFEPIPLAFGHFGCFPNARRPRVLWAGLEEGAEELVRLHDAIEARMIDLGGYRREERGYTPHVTLGRIQGDAPVPPALLTAVAQPPASPLGHMTAREVQVLSSELKAEGPVYTVLSRAKLGGK